MEFMEKNAKTIYTIGHSLLQIDRFVALLTEHGITAVADVRSHPASRINPSFNESSLAARLKGENIAYVFLGRELGGRPADPRCYVNNQVQYELVAQTDYFRAGLERLARGAERYRIALLCAEREPLACHRALLISRHLVTRGYNVEHIHDDGRLENHRALLVRMLRSLGYDERVLGDETELDKAYREQSSRIAYRLKEPFRSVPCR